MGMPIININFKENATVTVQRAERGTLLLILRDTVPDVNPAVVTAISDMPTGITSANADYIKLALKGNESSPQKIYCYFVADDEELATNCFAWAETKHIDWVCCPTATTDSTVTTISNWVKSVNANSNNFVMAVLPNSVSDNENIVNFATTNVYVGSTTYTAEQYCARIAGLIAGTSLSSSVTYAVLEEADSCSSLSKSDMDAAVNAGKLICFFDGEKVKLGRGVNSLTTTSSSKGAQFKKIKIAETINTIKYDLYRAIEDGYVGKYANIYANRKLLLTAVQDYFDTLESEGLISDYTASFDIPAIKSAMTTAGINYSNMSDNEIEAYDFGTTVYISIACRMIDAIEDVYINIAI